MTLSEHLKQALDRPIEEGVVELHTPAGRVRVAISAVGPIGARISELEVEVELPASAQVQADALQGHLPTLESPLRPVEVDVGLGGGVLRSAPARAPGELDSQYYELELRGGRGRLRRFSTQDRTPIEMEVTRRALGRLVDKLASGLQTDAS